ncbi:MAG: 50S ribosomal protein L25/general stress protein Ctc [Anaerolineae bacterium]
MAETYTLEADVRTTFGKKVRHLRRADMIPAVIYGIGDPVHIAIKRRPLEVALKHAGSTHIIQVTVDGTSHPTLVRDVQRHVIRKDIVHVDFLKVDLTKTLRTDVAIELVNYPKLPSELMITHPMISVTVECLPTAIPETIRLDVSALRELGQRLTVANLPQLPGVKFIADETEVIARVESLTSTQSEETEEGSMAEPEVVERGKKVEAEEA